MKHFGLGFVRQSQREVTSTIKSDRDPLNVNNKFVVTSGRTASIPLLVHLFPTRSPTLALFHQAPSAEQGADPARWHCVHCMHSTSRVEQLCCAYKVKFCSCPFLPLRYILSASIPLPLVGFSIEGVAHREPGKVTPCGPAACRVCLAPPVLAVAGG